MEQSTHTYVYTVHATDRWGDLTNNQDLGGIEMTSYSTHVTTTEAQHGYFLTELLEITLYTTCRMRSWDVIRSGKQCKLPAIESVQVMDTTVT